MLGLCYLNRPEWFLAFPVAAAALWPGAGGRATRMIRLTLPFLALSGIFLLFVRAETGRWALSGKDHWQYQLGVHQWRTRDQPLQRSGVPELRKSVPSALEHVRSHPVEALLGYGYRWTILIRNLWAQIGLLLLPFLAVGLIHAWRQSHRDLVLLLFPLSLLPVLAAVGTFFRHAIVGGAVLVAIAGAGMALLLRAFLQRDGSWKGSRLPWP